MQETAVTFALKLLKPRILHEYIKKKQTATQQSGRAALDVLLLIVIHKGSLKKIISVERPLTSSFLTEWGFYNGRYNSNHRSYVCIFTHAINLLTTETDYLIDLCFERET